MEITRAQIDKAATAKSSDELYELAQAEGIDITKEEAEKYFQQLSSSSLDLDALEDVAGGCTGNACAGNVAVAC
jgi:hypothetical protein